MPQTLSALPEQTKLPQHKTAASSSRHSDTTLLDSNILLLLAVVHVLLFFRDRWAHPESEVCPARAARWDQQELQAAPETRVSAENPDRPDHQAPSDLLDPEVTTILFQGLFTRKRWKMPRRLPSRGKSGEVTSSDHFWKH